MAMMKKTKRTRKMLHLIGAHARGLPPSLPSGFPHSGKMRPYHLLFKNMKNAARELCVGTSVHAAYKHAKCRKSRTVELDPPRPSIPMTSLLSRDQALSLQQLYLHVGAGPIAY